jgi:hypothetical protein
MRSGLHSSRRRAAGRAAEEGAEAARGGDQRAMSTGRAEGHAGGGGSLVGLRLAGAGVALGEQRRHRG